MPDYNVTLSQEEWGIVIGIIVEKPFKDVVQLMNKLQQQLSKQQQANERPSGQEPET